MTIVNVVPIETPELQGRLEAAGDKALKMNLAGSADLSVKASLDRFLQEVHNEALRVRAGEVSVDLRRLEFVNSSCLKGFVNWILAVEEQPSDRQYRITFVSSPTIQWQRRSLHALSCLASDLVTVST
jgi:hypothetical protein